MKKIFLILCCYFLISPANAQIVRLEKDHNSVLPAHQQNAFPAPQQSTQAQNKRNPATEPEANIPEPRQSGFLRDYGDQKDARNIKIVEAVAHYKLSDEKLLKEISKLDNNREFNKKMQKIMDNLSNDKQRNSKNKEVINILQDAGNKLYNLLAN